MRPATCVFDTSTGLNLIRADALEPSRLGSIRHTDMPVIRSASDAKLTVPRTITLHIRIGETHTLVNVGDVNEKVMPVFI